MTFYHTSPTAEGLRKTRAVSIGLLVLLTSGSAHGVCVHQRSYVNSLATQSCEYSEPKPLMYLTAVGAIPLRFAPPPPVATERPKKAEPIESAPVSSTKVEPTSVDTPHETAPEPKEDPAISTESKPSRILPDDTPRDVRAEDVLPYFQLSNDSSPTPNVSVPFTPASPAQPQSSATYILK